MSVHCLKECSDVFYRLAVSSNHGVFGQRTWFGPSNAFPRRVVCSHLVNLSVEEVGPGLLGSGVIRFLVLACSTSQKSIFGVLTLCGPPCD